MENNCSNCEYSRVRRTEPFCTNKKSIKYQEVTNLYYICDKYKRGTQWEILSTDGTEIIFPRIKK